MVQFKASDIQHFAEAKIFQGEKVNSIVINPQNLLPNTLLVSGIDNGCCGSDGMDGPNRSCQCGAVIAIERSDCWTPAKISFLSDAVKLTN
jgi:hypothetical protein